METDEDMYKASPQLSGSIAHSTTNNQKSSTRKDDLMSFPVYSDELGIMGIIDIYKSEQQLLIERKNNLKQIFKGQLYQLWAQYFCMVEMGYIVRKIAFYEISTNKMFYKQLPSNEDKCDLKQFIEKIRKYTPDKTIFNINPNKCKHCIYCSLCDKTIENNVYT